MVHNVLPLPFWKGEVMRSATMIKLGSRYSIPPAWETPSEKGHLNQLDTNQEAVATSAFSFVIRTKPEVQSYSWDKKQEKWSLNAADTSRLCEAAWDHGFQMFPANLEHRGMNYSLVPWTDPHKWKARA